jgi:hypothetical protein
MNAPTGSSDGTATRSVLIVANRAAGGVHLRDALLSRAVVWPTTFTLVVPATPPPEGWTWSEDEAHRLAARRLHLAIERLRAAGLDVTGRLGDHDPMEAVADALLREPFDEIVLSTLPAGLSRWLRSDLPSRMRRRFATALTVVTADAPDAVAQPSEPRAASPVRLDLPA